MDNPFRPASGMYPPYFAGRSREVGAFKKNLESLDSGVQFHMAIIGEWAIGKTALLKKFESIAREDDFLIYYCVARPRSGELFSNIMSGLSAEIKREFGETFLQKIAGKISLEAIGMTLFGLKGELKFSNASSATLPFREFFTNLWEEIGSKKKGIIILVDDLDTVDDFKEVMLTLRAISMETIEKVKLMFVIAGAPILFKKMYIAHAPLLRFFEPLELGRLTEEESKSAILAPLRSISKNAKEEVLHKLLVLCNGHPYYIQEFCYHIVESTPGKVITKDDFSIGFQRAMDDIAQKIFSQRLSEISPSQQKVLSIMRPREKMTQTMISEEAQSKGIKASTVRASLRVLKEKGFIKQFEVGEDKGKYLAEDSLLIEYLNQIDQ